MHWKFFIFPSPFYPLSCYLIQSFNSHPPFSFPSPSSSNIPDSNPSSSPFHVPIHLSIIFSSSHSLKVFRSQKVFSLQLPFLSQLILISISSKISSYTLLSHHPFHFLSILSPFSIYHPDISQVPSSLSHLPSQLNRLWLLKIHPFFLSHPRCRSSHNSPSSSNHVKLFASPIHRRWLRVLGRFHRHESSPDHKDGIVWNLVHNCVSLSFIWNSLTMYFVENIINRRKEK